MKDEFKDTVPVAGLQAGRRPLQTQVLVSVAHECAEQVVLMNSRGPVQLQTRSGSDAGVELIGCWFFPRNCRLDLTFPQIDAMTEEAGAEPGKLVVSGVVRKVQGLSPEPTYAIWVQFDSIDQSVLGAWQVALEFGIDELAEPGEG